MIGEKITTQAKTIHIWQYKKINDHYAQGTEYLLDSPDSSAPQGCEDSEICPVYQ